MLSVAYHASSHLTHRVFQSHKYRARNDVVADVEFRDLLDLCDRADVSISQSVARGDVQSILRRQFRGLSQSA